MCLYKGAIPQALYNIGWHQKSGVIADGEAHNGVLGLAWESGHRSQDLKGLGAENREYSG